MRLLLGLLLSLPLSAAECPPKEPYSCLKYLYNHDGDTITFRSASLGKVKVRVVGIDTPEITGKGKGSPCQYEKSQAAKRFVADELKKASRIDLSQVTGKDIYGRVLGKVIFDGKDLGPELIGRKLAMVYHKRRQHNVNWCKL